MSDATPPPEDPQPAGDLEPRVARLESEVSELRQECARGVGDAAAARVLAAGADRDVSDMRLTLDAHRRALNALAETLSDTRREMREGFARLDGRMDRTNGEFAQLRAEMRAGFAAIAMTLDRIVGDGGRA